MDALDRESGGRAHGDFEDECLGELIPGVAAHAFSQDVKPPSAISRLLRRPVAPSGPKRTATLTWLDPGAIHEGRHSGWKLARLYIALGDELTCIELATLRRILPDDLVVTDADVTGRFLLPKQGGGLEFYEQEVRYNSPNTFVRALMLRDDAARVKPVLEAQPRITEQVEQAAIHLGQAWRRYEEG